jgi:hypothetical protein
MIVSSKCRKRLREQTSCREAFCDSFEYYDLCYVPPTRREGKTTTLRSIVMSNMPSYQIVILHKHACLLHTNEKAIQSSSSQMGY